MTEDEQILNDGLRVEEDNVIRLERPRVDTIVAVPTDIGSGVPLRNERTDQEIAADIYQDFEFEKPCRVHETPGCTSCHWLIKSLRRNHIKKEIISPWLRYNAPWKLAFCQSSIDKLYDYLEQNKIRPEPEALLLASQSLDLKLAPNPKPGVRQILIEPSLETPPSVQPFQEPCKPEGRPGRPRKEKYEKPKILTLREQCGLTSRQVLELMSRPDFNLNPRARDWDAIHPDVNPELRQCYFDLTTTGRGSYGEKNYKRGYSVRVVTTAQEFETLLPMTTGVHFSPDELRLYSDYANQNFTKKEIRDRWVKGAYGTSPDLTELETKIINRLLDMDAIPTRVHLSEVVDDIEGDHERGTEAIEKAINRGAEKVDSIVAGKRDLGSNRIGQHHKLNSFEINGGLRRSRSGETGSQDNGGGNWTVETNPDDEQPD